MLSFSFENQIAHLLLFCTREVKSYLAPADPAVFVVTLSGGLEEVTDPSSCRGVKNLQLPLGQSSTLAISLSTARTAAEPTGEII